MTICTIANHTLGALAAILATTLLVLGVLGAWIDLTSPRIKELSRVLGWSPSEAARARGQDYRARVVWLACLIGGGLAWWEVVISW